MVSKDRKKRMMSLELEFELEPDHNAQRELTTQLFCMAVKTQGPTKKTFPAAGRFAVFALSIDCMWTETKFSPIQSIGNTTRAKIAPHLF